MNKKAILIAGPTASGKSALAIELARAYNGVIINADALQIYKCYRILTARPSDEDLALAPHALYGHCANEAGYSVGEWLREVKAFLATSDQLPIFTGGTGLYFKALINGLAEIPAISDKTRNQLEERLEKGGIDDLREELSALDPVIYQSIDLQNPRRIIRALEVVIETGKPLSSWQAETPPPLFKLEDCDARLVLPDVKTTNSRIEKRFDLMLNMGAIEEVEAQMQPWDAALPANQALGAKEIAAFLQGEKSLETAREEAITATRQYAKRQRTWFRSNMKNWQEVNLYQHDLTRVSTH